MRLRQLAAWILGAAGVALVGGAHGLVAQQLKCPTGGTLGVVVLGGELVVTCTPPAPPPPTTVAPTIGSFQCTPTTIALGASSTCSWSQVAGVPTPTLTMNQGVGPVTGAAGSRVLTPATAGQHVVTLTATNSAGSVARSWTVVVTAPTATVPFGGPVDAAILGDFTQAEHDRFSRPWQGGRYREWHAQCPDRFPTGEAIAAGRCFAHEHGDDPAPATAALVQRIAAASPQFIAKVTARPVEEAEAIRATWLEVATEPILFGYIGHKTVHLPGEPSGHVEPDEGFKVFTAFQGDCNEEGRCDLTLSRSLFHMGTGGPLRFTRQDHSNDLAYWNDTFGFVRLRLMNDTGGTGRVCDPRSPEPVKDVIGTDTLAVCKRKLDSQYEIWTTSRQLQRTTGVVIGRSRAVPAVFDPLTIFDPANPTALIYLAAINGVIDPRAAAQFNWPQPGDNRGCERESYAQAGEFRNSGGPWLFYASTFGRELPATDPLAIRHVIPAMDVVDHRSATPNAQDVATGNKGNQAFKLRVDYCRGRTHTQAGIVARPGVAGRVNAAKLGLKN